MLMLRRGLLAVLAAGFLSSGAVAQDADRQALADIRAELTRFYAEIAGVRAQLEAEASTGASPQVTGPATLRLDQLEVQLGRLTGQVEQLSNRMRKIAEDGTRRVADLEFRLVELEGGDISALGDTPLLGGAVDAPVAAAPNPPIETVELAVSEEADFERAEQALGDGEYASAILGFGQFLTDYPGGPMSARAMYHMGEAQEALGQHKEAARSYLDSFTVQPNGAYSAQALTRVGLSLGALGKIDNACQTLNEVLARYPDSDAVWLAQSKRTELGCS